MAQTELTYYRKDYQHKFDNGISTFLDDFERVVLPELEGDDRVVVSNGAFIKEYMVPEGAEVAVHILHSRSRQIVERGYPHYLRPVFVSSYRPEVRYLLHKGKRAFFVPMSVDVESLPRGEGNGRWIYFGNLYSDKVRTYNMLKEHIEFDTISFGRFNDSEEQLSREECLELVSGYSYGIGVGRCVQEMMGMGLRCVVAGREYGGAILNRGIFNTHLQVNCNSDMSTSWDVKRDVIEIERMNDYILPTDMRSQVGRYETIIQKSVL